MRAALVLLLLCTSAAGVEAATQVPVPFTTLAAGDKSGILTLLQTVVRSEAAWRALWQQHAPGRSRQQAIPRVDFSQFMVIAVFAGRSPARTQVRIESIAIRDARLVVTLTVTTPPAVLPPDPGEAAPFHIVRLRRLDLPVVFAVSAAQQDPIRPPTEPHGP